MLISIPPKYAVSKVVGYMKRKNAIHIARAYLGQKKNYNVMHFLARGYFVSTVAPMRRLFKEIYETIKRKVIVSNRYRSLNRLPSNGGQKIFLAYRIK
jgi:putative transposase